MEWQRMGSRLSEVLGLGKAPVAVTFADDLPEGVEAPKCRVCSAVRMAAEGRILALGAENSACPGGSHYLGLRAMEPERAAALREFLIGGEKLLASPAAIHRMQVLSKARPPLGIANYVLFSPLESAPVRPDVIVVACNAWQGARLVNLLTYETGLPMECDPTGAFCRSAITYPLVTGKTNVTFGDVTARRSESVPEDELYVCLPYGDFEIVVRSIDDCGAGAPLS
jgi:uncharacterized protein (DUF169 family)